MDLQYRGLCFFFPAFTSLIGLGTFHRQLRLRVSHLGHGEVFTLDGHGVRIGDRYTHFPLGFLDLRFSQEFGTPLANRLFLFKIGHANRLISLGFTSSDRLLFTGLGHLNRFIPLGGRDPSFTHFLIVRHVTAGFLDRLRGSLLANGVDISRLVGDVGYVHVNQQQTDFVQLRFERSLNVLEERLAVTINVLDPHRGDDLTKLAEDDFLSLLAHLAGAQAEQTNGGVLHHSGFGSHRNGKDARHIYADVFDRKRTAQRYLDLYRFQTEIGVILQQWDDERRAAMHGSRRLSTTCSTVDDQDPVARTALVLSGY